MTRKEVPQSSSMKYSVVLEQEQWYRPSTTPKSHVVEPVPFRNVTFSPICNDILFVSLIQFMDCHFQCNFEIEALSDELIDGTNLQRSLPMKFLSCKILIRFEIVGVLGSPKMRTA